MPPSPTRLTTGSVFAAAYRIVRPLGESSDRDALYLATHSATARACVLRVLAPRLVAEAEGRARFDEVCGLRAGIESGHVVELLDAGVDKASSAPWFAMPFVKGETLERYAAAPLSEEDALEALAQLAHALASMNAVGSVHGALDPAKLIVTEGETYGSPFSMKVLDFWTAALLRERVRPYTADDAALRWSAPETLDPDAPLTRASDVWSYGLLAFRLLTGVAYWQGAGDALRAEVTAAPIEPAGRRARALGVAVALPEGFDEWFARCVARAPDARFADVDAALDALEPLLGGGMVDEGPRPAAAPRAVAAAPLVARLKSPPWMRSIDFMVPAALVLVTLAALGVRQVVRARRSRGGARTVATAPAAPGAASPGAASPAPSTFTAGNLDERATADLIRRLSALPHGTPAWIAVTADDPAATARAEQLREIFTRAGWDARPLQRYAGRLRPGYFLFVADMEPPEYVTKLSTALRANRLVDDYFRGYRDYYRDRTAADPTFVGFPMERDQTFILAVGRTP